MGWIAIIFLRNQVRSILRLATAAEAFGRGTDAPDYRPTGATEVRRAGYAFIAMRERIKRQIRQRTDMLAGVSHDLRTPLTRLKLSLAMLKQTPEVLETRQDVDEMERMLDGYLAFVRNQATDEETQTLKLSSFLSDMATRMERAGRSINLTIPDNNSHLNIRVSAVRRAIENLLNNAHNHGENVWLSANITDQNVELIIDDDGPGIDPEHYEDVFKPFTRLDEARNQNQTGVGLGLSVVRDVSRSHGGDIRLGKAPQGGLRAIFALPI